MPPGNEPIVRKVLTQDPREKRRKSQREILQEWKERRLGGLVFIVPALLAMAYLVYWFGFEKPEDFVPARPLPPGVRWAIGVAVCGVFGWFLYGAAAYRCPRCGNHVFLRGTCLLCRARLD